MLAALYFASLVENLFETRLSAVARQEKFRNLAYNYVSPQAKSLLVILWPIGCCQDFYRSIVRRLAAMLRPSASNKSAAVMTTTLARSCATIRSKCCGPRDIGSQTKHGREHLCVD
ncbi:hypothetical protein V2J81_16155 [Pseudomonas alliivorans]|nr:hypothetical protein [Pseudomonas alliivorans]